MDKNINLEEIIKTYNLNSEGIDLANKLLDDFMALREHVTKTSENKEEHTMSKKNRKKAKNPAYDHNETLPLLKKKALDYKASDKHNGEHLFYSDMNTDINEEITKISATSTDVQALASVLVNAAINGHYFPTNTNFTMTKMLAASNPGDLDCLIPLVYVAYVIDCVASGDRVLPFGIFGCYFKEGAVTPHRWFLQSPYGFYVNYTDWLEQLRVLYNELHINTQLIIEFEITYNMYMMLVQDYTIRKECPTLMYLLTRKYEMLLDKFKKLESNILAATKIMTRTF